MRRLSQEFESLFCSATETAHRSQRPTLQARPRLARPMSRRTQSPRTSKGPRRRSKPLARLTGFVASVSVMMAMLTTDLPDHIAQLLVTVMSPSLIAMSAHRVRIGKTSAASRRRVSPAGSSEKLPTDVDPLGAAKAVSIRASSYVAGATRSPNFGVRRRSASPCRAPAAAGRWCRGRQVTSIPTAWWRTGSGATRDSRRNTSVAPSSTERPFSTNAVRDVGSPGMRANLSQQSDPCRKSPQEPPKLSFGPAQAARHSSRPNRSASTPYRRPRSLTVSESTPSLSARSGRWRRRRG